MKKQESAKLTPGSAIGKGPKPLATHGQKVGATGDIVDLILKDHVPLKKLIETLKKADVKREEKEDKFEEFATLLTIHAKSEQQSLYVQMKEDSELRMESFEGFTEHAMADQLVQEINRASDDDEWNAKVKVLAESVEHHIKEEEGDVLLQVKEELDDDTRAAVGAEYLALKADYELLKASPNKKKAKIVEHHIN